MEGSSGYRARSNTALEYWGGHLAIAPDYLDSSGYIASFGQWNGEAKQFIKDVGVEMGIVKYELSEYAYYKPDGQKWDFTSLVQGLKVGASSKKVIGCVALQLVATRELQVEQFPGTACSAVSALTAEAKTYIR